MPKRRTPRAAPGTGKPGTNTTKAKAIGLYQSNPLAGRAGTPTRKAPLPHNGLPAAVEAEGPLASSPGGRHGGAKQLVVQPQLADHDQGRPSQHRALDLVVGQACGHQGTGKGGG
jgi:hypothetical protein